MKSARSRSGMIFLAVALGATAGVVALLPILDGPGGAARGNESVAASALPQTPGHSTVASKGAHDVSSNSDPLTADGQPVSTADPGFKDEPADESVTGGESADDVDLDARPRPVTRAERDAWINQPQPYPEHIDELPRWHVTEAEAERRRAAGLPVGRTTPPPGPEYDDDGDLYVITHVDPNQPYGRRVQYTWGEPRPDDIQDWVDLPLVGKFLEEFGLWMQRDDDLYGVGFQAADGRFFRADSGGRFIPGSRDSRGYRAFEDVPAGRNIPNVGSQRLYAVEGYTFIQSVRIRGGYVVPGLSVIDHPGTPETENIFVTFEGYPRLAIDLLTGIYERDRRQMGVRLAKMWQVDPEIVVIPRPAE